MLNTRYIYFTTKTKDVSKLNLLESYLTDGLEGEIKSLRAPYIYAKNNITFIHEYESKGQTILVAQDLGVSEISYFKTMMYWLEETFKALELDVIKLNYVISDPNKIESTDDKYEFICKYILKTIETDSVEESEFESYTKAMNSVKDSGESFEFVYDDSLILKGEHLRLYQVNIIDKSCDMVLQKYTALLKLMG